MAFRTFGPQETGGGTPISIEYIDKPGLGHITLLNFVLSLITFSIYRFWGKTNVRRHIWSCVHINGEPLEYTGRGKELFLGFLIVFGLIILPIFALVFILQISLGPEHPALILVNLAVALFVMVFWGMALYRARRYQLSRTLWRGIRGALVGSSWTYSFLYFGAALLRSMTLGWSTPAMNLNLQERMTGDMRFGSMPFRFKGRAGPLYGPYAICWFVTLAVFVVLAFIIGYAFYGIFGDILGEIFGKTGSDGPSRTDRDFAGAMIVIAILVGFLLFSVISAMTWAFYTAREMAIFASYTTFDLARFQLDATGWSLIGLVVGNLLLVIFTLGIATPFAQQRLVRYMCNRISVHGRVRIDEILQSREVMGRTGEGLADAFDVGGI